MGIQRRNGEAVSETSVDIKAQQIRRLQEIFPEVVTEGKIDFSALRATLGDVVDDRPERYSFSWAGKRDAVRLLQTPSRATVVPVPDESENFDTTQHIFIEGDNLEVLKLLYKSYFGRVKLIYIDPPYNTGKDFVYPDNYTDPLEYYLQLTGQRDTNGNLTTSNPETSGRKHSTWLSLMYPRLFLARQLLRDEGVILVSIDDHEAYNLRMVMNEIFGEENFIAQLVWEKGRKNDAKLFSVGHEYMIMYARSLATLRELKTVWREPKPGAQEIWDQYLLLRQKLGQDDAAIERDLQEWYKTLPAKHPSRKLSRYRHVDKYGPWRDRDISWPGGDGPRYEVLHDRTKKPVPVPERGWGFASPETMERQIKLGLVVFREEDTKPPFRKAHLHPIVEELDEEEDAILNGDEEEQEEEAVGLQVMGSYIYKQSQTAVKYLRKLMGAKIFDNPKDHEVLARIINYCTSPDEGDIILDFFAGAATTAEAVLRLNHEHKDSNRRFVMVQLQEPTPKKSAARKAGYVDIAQIGKKRIRQVIADIQQERASKLDLDDRKVPEDLGFRVFKLVQSNIRAWPGYEGNDPSGYLEQMEFFLDSLTKGWTPEKVIWEVAIREGYGLNARIEPVTGVHHNAVSRVTNFDKGQSFLICLDDTINPLTLKDLALTASDLFICRDVALDDSTGANLALQCRLKTI
jgi:adenine-specific DNA-methyltransferase